MKKKKKKNQKSNCRYCLQDAKKTAKKFAVFLHIKYVAKQQKKRKETLKKKYKINLHILEVCNFRCRQCFSKFGTEKLLPVKDWEKIVDNCIAGADVAEFNIAGGEPMLYPGLVELVQYIRDKGVKVSLITNGSLMNEEWIKNYAGMFETIGFSVDSINDETNRKIGRCDRNGKTIPTGRIVELCGLIRKYAPGCRIKINTVVSALNKDEVMSDFIDEIATDRWKILRMKTFSMAASQTWIFRFRMKNLSFYYAISLSY